MLTVASMRSGRDRGMMLGMKALGPLLALSCSLVLACSEEEEGDGATDHCETCNLDEQIPMVAVAGATDCGSVGITENASAAIACIEQALADGTPFMVRRQVQGTDSTVIYAWVTDESGEVRYLAYDSNICGGAGGCNEQCGPRVSSSACGSPRVGADPSVQLVDCDDVALTSLCEPPL